MTTAQPVAPPQSVPIQSLSIQDLLELKQKLTLSVQHRMLQVNALKSGKDRFEQSNKTLDWFNHDNKDGEVLVPLTSSLYVKGTLADVDNVLIDVGTGYYLQKKIPDAKKYCQEKINMLAEKTKEGLGDLQEKRYHLMVIEQVLQKKIESAQKSTA